MTSISQQQQPSSQASNSLNATPADSVRTSSPSISGTSSPLAAAPAPATARSYANATKKPFSPPIASSTTGSTPAVGGQASAQHGKSNSISPVNGKNSIPPAVPAVATPTIVSSGNAVNGVSAQGGHSRKSSVTISAAGTSGFIPNGGPVAGPPSRTNSIQFGSMNAGGSPVATKSTPQASASLPVASPSNPRVTSPATSPSPIPQPPASGGRPPSGLQGQGNGINFGSLGGESGESNRQARPVSMPQGPLAPGPQQGHLRRESSQSTHSDMGNPGMGPGPGRGGYPPQGGRGRGYPQPYPQQMGYSPGPQFRGAPNQRGGPNVAPQFPGQGGPMGQYPGSPHRAARSPALSNSHPATPQMQQVPMANPQMHPSQYGGYAPHMGPPQVKPQSSSVLQHDRPRHPPKKEASHKQHLAHTLHNPPLPNLAPDSPFFEQYLMMRNQGQYGMPQHFDPAYAQYQGQYNMYPQMQYMAAPSSPRPSYHMPQGAQPQYIQGQYAGHPQGQPMSRTSSAVSERPNSSVGQPQTPSLPPATSHSHQPSHGSSSPAPTSDFKIPTRGKSAGIIIKDPTSGAVKTFDKTPSSPAPVSRSPAIVSSTPTPPPRPSSNDPHHARSDSRSVKTDEEKKNDMRDAIAKKIEADKAEERRLKDEEQRKAAKDQEDADKALKEAEESKEKAQKAEQEAADKAQQEKEAAEQAQKDADEKAEKEHEDKARKEEEERAQKEKEKDDKAEKAKKEADARTKAEAEMRNAEREAEEAEEARLKARAEQEESEESKAEKASLFASLKNRRAPPTSATPPPPATKAPVETGTSTPASEDSMAPPAKPSSAKREKPAALKLETKKPVEPAQPSAALQSLRSARPIDRLSDVTYPSSIASPNPALNTASTERKFKYQRDFLLQFQPVFTEKPSEDWENRVKETVGDTSDSSRPQSARTPSMMSGGRTPSGRPGVSATFPMGMGNFVGQGRTLPPQTTSADRYAMSIGQQPRPPMANPLASLAGRPGGFPLPGQGSMSRSGSQTQLSQSGPGSRNAREVSRRGQRSKNGSERIDSHKGGHGDSSKMPLTAGAEIKSLQVSSSGWKPRSIGASATGAAGPAPGDSGHMAPDMVQRKVKSNLNKMTPEKFDKIADQILEIAAQSKDESDGRTLRQVIQLTFEKATDEAHWASMYAKFCKRMLETMNPEIKDENIKDKNGNVVTGGNLFRKYLLNRCQEEFERGWKVNLPPKPEGESEEAAMLSDEYYIAAAAKRRGLGLVQFIGELYKLGMLTERIMHECVKKLVDFEGTPDEAEVESLTKLLKTIGRSLDSTERGPALMEVYFQRINAMVELPDLHSRLKFMLMDIIDLRRKGWKSKDSEKGPKTIQEIREEAQAAQQEKELERQRQNQRGGGGGGRMHLGRGDARSFSGGGYGMQPPPDYQKNTVGMDDLRRLGSKAGSRQLSQGPVSFGPTSMFNSRSSSGRKTLGPGGSLRAGEDSGASSRTGTPPAQKEKEKESTTHVNAFSALAALDSEHPDVTSPPSSPPTSKTKPAASAAASSEPAPSSDAAAKGDAAKTT
ncbi:MAG: hypothetical protein M1819_000883 [Sarea resinae]|nr:MAG: hypothetical protein M1819_000883 [Sarea resinae]